MNDEKHTAEQVDLRNLIYADTQFGHRSETDLKLAELQSLVARGWMQEGEDNNEFDVTDAGRAAIAAALRQQAEQAGGVVSGGWDGEAYVNMAGELESWKRRALQAERFIEHEVQGQAFMGEPLIHRPQAPAEQDGRVDEGGTPALPWRSIDKLPESDDLFWFLRGDIVDGPRRPQLGGYDADRWDYFAPCIEPPITAALAQNAQGGVVAEWQRKCPDYPNCPNVGCPCEPKNRTIDAELVGESTHARLIVGPSRHSHIRLQSVAYHAARGAFGTETEADDRRVYQCIQAYTHAERARVPDGWQPTADAINALPPPVRNYIMALETNAIPAGMVRENVLVREENEMLRALLAAPSQPEDASHG